LFIIIIIINITNYTCILFLYIFYDFSLLLYYTILKSVYLSNKIIVIKIFEIILFAPFYNILILRYFEFFKVT